MLVSMDRAGRVVIPKELREELALTPDTPMELDIDGDGIRLVPDRTRRRPVVEIDVLLALAPADNTVLTDADVQRWRDAGQR